MALLRLTLDGEKYAVDPDKLTLGEACTMEEDFGMEDLSSLNFFKARHLRGLFFVAVKRKHPELAEADILAKVLEGVTGDVYKDLNKQVEEAIKKAEAEKADPPKAAAGPSAAARNGVKTRGTAGSRSTAKS